MGKISCPLCCNETFATPSSLKCHLQEIMENFRCPLCVKKFAGVSELVEHLNTNCVEIEVVVKSNSSQEDNDSQGTIEDSILARALLEGKSEIKTEEEEEAEDVHYFCQSCDVSFKDIDGHLSQFHENQEIILEDTTDSTPEEPTDSDSVILIVNSSENPDEDSELSETSSKPSKKSKTIVEQDCKDKSGRLYTRKFVKIDKFWEEGREGEHEEEEEEVELILPEPEPEPPKEEQKEIPAPVKYPIKVNLCTGCKRYYPEGAPHECELKPTKPKVHSCEVCNTIFPTFKSLRLHKRMHDPIKTRGVGAPVKYEEGEEPRRLMFACKICYKNYDKAYEEVHMASHESNNEYNCLVCNRKFFTKTNLEMHMKAHSNKKKFTCSYCKKLYVTYDALNDHLLNQCQKRPYACQYCGRRFSRPHEKVKHERIHTGEKPHVCEICGKAFRVSYCLTLHLRTHSGTRPYQCTKCGKRFKSHSVYNHHLLTHSDVRAYKCPYCPKAFKTGVQLAGHKNSHIKPFTCNECNRPFASLYAVRAHMETHKRENNLKYDCWMCGAQYSRVFALRDHLKQQHQHVEKPKEDVVGMEEELEAANSILVNEDDIILGLDQAASIEIIEGEGE